MKKIVFIIFISCLVVSSVYGVTKLTFEQHALKTDFHNDMVITKFQNPGLSGANQIWDFSSLNVLSDFKGLIQNPKFLKNSFFSNQFNTELIEFGNSFYFNITDTKLELTGYRSSNGNVEINYEKPFLKMVYPFEYGNSYTGSFSGVIKNGSKLGQIDGTYDVEADGFGKLILPNNVEVNNALRVKTIKRYTQSFSSSSSVEITITTYRWYTQNVRYPLLVLITTEYGYGDKKSVSHQAAYNNNINEIMLEAFDFENSKVYPNPFSNVIRTSYELSNDANVLVEIFDITGKKVTELLNERQQAGFYDEPFDVNDLRLKNGMYNIRITIDGVQQNYKLLRVDN